MRLAGENSELQELRIGDVMTRRVLTVSPDDDILAAARADGRAAVRHLPVVQDGMVMGIVGLRDVTRSLLELVWRDTTATRARRPGSCSSAPDPGTIAAPGRIAQRESARLTRERSVVRSHLRPSGAACLGGFRLGKRFMRGMDAAKARTVPTPVPTREFARGGNATRVARSTQRLAVDTFLFAPAATCAFSSAMSASIRRSVSINSLCSSPRSSLTKRDATEAVSRERKPMPTNISTIPMIRPWTVVG